MMFMVVALQLLIIHNAAVSNVKLALTPSSVD